MGATALFCFGFKIFFFFFENFLVLSFESPNWDELYFCYKGNLSTQRAGIFLGPKGEKEALSL